jgi:hypothetical protein
VARPTSSIDRVVCSFGLIRIPVDFNRTFSTDLAVCRTRNVARATFSIR